MTMETIISTTSFMQSTIQLAAVDVPVLSITNAFNAATFLPQPFWLLLILAPTWNVTKAVMGPLTSVIGFSLVHLLIVVLSLGEPGGTAPISDFALVFNPSGNPLAGMLNMMKYPNFVSEEWSHVLTWDLFIGRWIWLDGLKRNVFTPHSILLTNLIGPPGFLLHILTGLIQGKGLPNDNSDMNDNIENEKNINVKNDKTSLSKPPIKPAYELINQYFTDAYLNPENTQKLISRLADNVVWEDTAESQPTVGIQAVSNKLLTRQRNMAKDSMIVIEDIADGITSSGFTWYYSQQGVNGKGLRGTTFVSFCSNDSGDVVNEGKIDYVREIAEPLFKPGSAIIPLLKAATEKGIKDAEAAAAKTNTTIGTTMNSMTKVPGELIPSLPFVRRDPISASDLVTYLWTEAQGRSDNQEFLRLVADDIIYEDFNYKTPFLGKSQVDDFLKEFDFPGITFIPEKISDGDKDNKSCCFTWRVQLAGVPVEQATKGISFYKLNTKNQLAYLRDIPEPAIKPPPLGTLATLVRPALRKFSPTTL